MEAKILPLTEENCEEACRLADEMFHYVPGATPTEWFRASLYPDARTLLKTKEPEVHGPVGYWVLDVGGRIVGTTGLYECEEDADVADWLGWFCVDESFRGKGLGGMLIRHSVAAVRARQKKLFRLYTSEHSQEADAQEFYQRHGFVPTRRIPSGRGYNYIYREKKLD